MSGSPGEGVARLAERAAREVRDRLEVGSPAAAIVLGSGLGGLAARLEAPRSLPFAQIPGFPAATVQGHEGALIAGTLAGREVLALAGRLHLYEGHPAPLVALPVRLFHALGARTLILSNAAGGIRRTFRPGDLMLIRDHLNLTGQNPLVGLVEPGDTRFPDMSAPYDAALLALLRESALAQRVAVVEGVYAGLLGPSYETPAEVRALERMGADAVGMSTVTEVIAARAKGMRVAAVSCITNLAAGMDPSPLAHEDVLRTTRVAADRFERLIHGLVARL